MYNKNKIQKTNEKKIMKKVKKQWVVASLAIFALLGGGAISAVQTGSQQVVANEESKTVSSSKTASDGYNDGIKAAKSETVDTVYNNQSQDYKTSYDNAKQGYIDGNSYNQNASNTNESYVNAYNSNPIVQGANAGVEAAKSNGNSTTENSEQKKSYEEAYKGVIAGKSNDTVTNSDIKDSAIYKKAFEIGQKITSDTKDNDKSKGIQDGIEKAKIDAKMTESYGLNSNQKTGTNPNGSLEYIDAYNKAYNTVVEGTNNPSQTYAGDNVYKDAYQIGKDIRNNDKTVLVSNSDQLHVAIQSSSTSDVTNIKAVRDISMWNKTTYNNKDVSSADTGTTGQTFSKPLTIDGGGHTIDFATSNYRQKDSADLRIQNIIMYGTDYYGPIVKNNSGHIWYDNIKYYGPQLVNSTSATIHINNSVYIDSRNPNYDRKTVVSHDVADNPGTGVINLPSGHTNQQNIQATNIVFEKNSEFYGYTNNGNVIELGTASVSVNENAKVNLYPKGSSAENEKNSYATGLVMAGGTLDIYNKASLNIYPQSDGNNIANALYLNDGNVNVNSGGIMSIKIDGELAKDQKPIDIRGNLNVYNGKLSVEKTGSDKSTSTSNLVTVTKSLTVKDKGSLGIAANGSGNYTLLKTSGTVDIQNPSNTSFDLNGNNVSGVVFDLRGNTNSSSKYIDGQDVKLKLITINDIPYANVTIPNGYPKNGILKGTNVESTTDGDKEPSDNKDNKYLQFKAASNFKINSADLVKDENTGKFTVNVSISYMDSYGNFTNSNYPIYLGVFAGNNKKAINASVKNEKFKLNTEQDYLYNQFETQSEQEATFHIDLPDTLTKEQIKQLQIRGQYIVGDETYKLNISDEQANRLLSNSNGKVAMEGAQNYLNNRYKTDYKPDNSKYLEGSVYKAGYDNAKSGYEYAISHDGDGNNSSEGYSKAAYDKGFIQGKSDKIADANGYNDAIKSIKKSSSNDTQTAYENGYSRGQIILEAISDAITNPIIDKKSGMGSAYNDAYDGARKAKDSSYITATLPDSENYQAGFNNTKGMQDALGENSDTIDPNKTGVSDGYKLTAKGIQDAKNNSETSEFSNSVFYQAGKAEYQNGKQAFLDGKADPKEDSTKTKAFKQAYADALDGYNQFDTNKNIDLSGNSQAFKDGYKTAQAVNDYLEGNEKQDSSNSAYNNAYEEAKKGAESTSSDLGDKSQAFQKAYNATKKQTEGASDFAKDSTKKMDSKKSEDLNYKAGFEGARDGQVAGAKDGYSGKVKTESELKDEGNPQAYIKSYSAASKAASLARQGAIEAVNENGQGEPEKAEDAYKSGYNGAKGFIQSSEDTKYTEANYQTGYNVARGISDRLANKATAVTREPANAYESGVKSVDDGQKDYHLSKSKDTDRYRNDKAYQIGYDKAESAVKDFLAGESAKDNNDGIYKDAYNKAVAGYNDVNKADDDSSVKQGNVSQAYKEARQVAKDQQVGADKYLANTTSNPDNSQSSKDGFEGAKAGQQDGAAGITKSENANKSKAYKDAYNNANQQAKEARDGAQDAIDGDSSKYNQQGAEKPTEAYKKGYEGAQKGLAKDTSDVSKDANTQTGYNLGKGTQDALNSVIQATTNSSDQGYKAAYDAVKAGAKSYQDGKADRDEKDTQNQSKYDNNASYKKGYDTAKQAVTDFTEGRTAQSNDALYREIYQNAVDGYNNASPNENDKKADYKTGQDSKIQGTAGSDAYQKQTDKEIKGKFYEDGYAGAKQATEDGLAKKSAKTDFSSLTLAYKDAYEATYPKAKEARKGAEAALENPNQTPDGGDFKSGFDGAKAGFNGDQKVNDANAQYVAAYDRAQGIKAALANPTVELAASDAHSESYKAGYRDAQTGIAASLNKESKAADTDQAYSKGYDAVDQGVKDYQAGVTPMPTGKNKAYEKGYTEAQSGHDDALKSGLNKEEDLSGQSKQYQDSYKATKAALYGQKDYLSSRTQTNKNKYPDYQDSYNEGFEGAKAGQSNGLSGASSNTKGKSAAYKVGYKFGYDSGYSSYLSNLGSGQLSGQNDGENGLPLADLSMYGGTYSSSYMAAYKQAYDNYQNGIAQADEDLTNGVKVDLSGKSKAYINGYNSISANMAQTTVSHIANEGVLIWDMVDGKPVQTSSYEHHQNSIRATKETKVIDGISYTKLANNRGWLQTKYLADPSSKAGVVNYISGYGVLVWNSGQNTMKSSETTELSLANVKTYDEKVIDGISYTRINAKDSDQWVQTQYLKPATPTPTSGVASVGNVPANHAIYLRDKDGNMTDQAIFADTSWKVFSQKRISGELYYCLGNDNQWIEAKYVTEFK